MNRATLTTLVAGALALGAAPAHAGSPTPCGADHPVQGALCGSVSVPVDRGAPGGPAMEVGYELYRAEAPAAAGTTVAIQGGPGVSTTATRDDFLGVFGRLAQTRDLVLVDARGTGTSGAIDCPALQRALAAPLAGDAAAAVRACSEQLGPAASHYGSDAIAEDVEAVRTALGLAAIDLYAPSAASGPALAYVLAHSDRVRSLVLDSPAVPGDEAFHGGQAAAIVRSVELVCRRSPSCRPFHRHPDRRLAALGQRLRGRPIEGLGAAPDGRLRRVRVDEALLATLASDTSSCYFNQGELPAAAAAALRDDPAALLRLAAEATAPGPADDPAVFSAGAQAATACRDGAFAWQRSRSPAERRQQYDSAVRALPAGRFQPFSVGAWLDSHQGVGVGGPFCLDWALGPDATPVPADGPLPAVPALLLTSDIDIVPVDRVRALAARIPGARLVVVPSARHVTAARSACAGDIVAAFVSTLEPPDTACVADAAPPWYGVGAFAHAAIGLTPARPEPGNRAGPRLRRTASAAWLAAYDAIQHSYRLSQPKGLGLRGGSYHAEFGRDEQTVTFRRTAFTGDVQVSGKLTLPYEDGTVAGSLQVWVGGEHVGTLRVRGLLFPHTERVTLSGALRGSAVRVSVPTA